MSDIARAQQELLADDAAVESGSSTALQPAPADAAPPGVDDATAAPQAPDPSATAPPARSDGGATTTSPSGGVIRVMPETPVRGEVARPHAPQVDSAANIPEPDQPDPSSAPRW